jgi:hypothetical protein
LKRWETVYVGIHLARLKNVKIDLATKTKPETLFNILYKDRELNSPGGEARLRKLEKEKSSKK